MTSVLIHRKLSIIITAVEIIDELGIQGLSTREISKRQGMSEGALFKHFKNKNELLLAVLDHFSQYDEDIIQSTKIKKMSPSAAIVFFMKSFATYYENYPAITAIDQSYDVLRYDPQLEGKVKEIFNNRIGFIKDMLDKAQGAGEIAAYVNSESLSEIIYGSYSTLVLKWRINNRNFPLRERVVSTLETILQAF
ncbi:TetR/AcrR family transcriptional regulator [Desulforamulus aquiferis]|uniref:TetR/AcrR family transcriptional regulator n=1 Tax=Desulforamulus aquiferis TaxID=1397668 RepID=A0AAW7ZAD5_9FIRM|nr:TetR/AcrR family transcriptional regulator [Desulforamulus aquiferis]MDO7786632.1 TetR/AcrR family transcriptional regulator [Desulforamulus aquiferis]RYD05847.1 hypothetical protein N752_08105 [Desulforamulus aquiferis]